MDNVEYPDYPGVKVEIIAITQLTKKLASEGVNLGLKGFHTPPEEVIDYAGRLCYDTHLKTGENPDRIQEWIKLGHESMVEHPSMTFHIWCSRVVTHELVRHRIASYSQRSQRYVKERVPQFIMPPELQEKKFFHYGWENRADNLFLKHMEACWNLYSHYLSLGAKPEIARYVLPNACETQIVTTMNFRELRHFIRLRTSKRALPEMQCMAGKVREICKMWAPNVFKDL